MSPDDIRPAIDAARVELAEKPLVRIQVETALTWAARACAAYERAAVSGSVSLSWLRDATEYEHEAIEHAALADPSGTLVRELHALFSHYRG